MILSMEDHMSLNDEIKSSRASIHTDGYPMSVNELATMYKDNELDIHPEFQRFFRWEHNQKVSLIESLLLNIPIQSIFVSQREDGVWDVIDGLQRLSTIFEFMGILRDKDGNKLPPLILTPTEKLPSLGDKRWEGNEDEAIGADNQLIIKRSKLDAKIILRESSQSAKFELFQRINSGGSTLTDQELRNCMIVAVNPEFYNWIDRLSKNEDFKSATSLTDKSLIERYDLELILRFIIIKDITADQAGNIDAFGKFLTDETIKLCTSDNFDYDYYTNMFVDVFKRINESMSDTAFKRYDVSKTKWVGGFLISAYELITIGITKNYDHYMSKGVFPDIKDIATIAWNSDNFKSKIGSGIRASTRLKNIIAYSESAFNI